MVVMANMRTISLTRRPAQRSLGGVIGAKYGYSQRPEAGTTCPQRLASGLPSRMQRVGDQQDSKELKQSRDERERLLILETEIAFAEE